MHGLFCGPGRYEATAETAGYSEKEPAVLTVLKPPLVFGPVGFQLGAYGLNISVYSVL